MFKYLRLMGLVKKVVNAENLLYNLSALYGIEFKMDWIGRIYAVINPLIKDGKYDLQSQIFEWDDAAPNGIKTANIEQWVFERLNVASEFIINNQLFDMMTFHIDKLDNKENYLLVLEPIGYNKFIKGLKVICGVIFLLIFLSILGLIIL